MVTNKFNWQNISELPPVYGEYDLVVIGAGPGGICSALAAARAGLKVAIVDRNGFPGGVITACNCPFLMGFSYEGQQISGGIFDELVRRMDKKGTARMIAADGCPETFPIAHRPLTENIATTGHGVIVTVNEMLMEDSVTRLFYSSLLGGIKNDGRLDSVIVDLQEGIFTLKGKYFIDATGDAALIEKIGESVVDAPHEDAMTKTILISVGGVKNFNKPEIRKRFADRVNSGDRPFANQDRFMGSATLNPEEVLLNLTLAVGSSLSSQDLTDLDSELREQIDIGLEWMRSRFPEFANCYLTSSATRVGVRASRNIVGLETITTNDLDNNTPVIEPIAIGRRYYGGHGLQSFNNEWDQNNKGLRGIPMKTLIPAGLTNVCAAGRCISADAKVLSSFRLTANCGAIGQAAGTMCAIAAKEQIAIPEVPYSQVKEELINKDAIINI